MSDHFLLTALEILKARLNRPKTDTLLDDYFAARISAAAKELLGKGITLDETDTADLMLVVDYAAYLHSARDKADGLPMWLTLRIRERWLQDASRQHIGGDAL